MDWLPWLLDWNDFTCDPFTSGGGSVGVGHCGAGGPAERLKELGQKGLAAGWATAAQANRIWLVSGATVVFNLLKNQCPEWDLQRQLAKNWKWKVCPETGKFWKQSPKRGLVTNFLQMGCYLMYKEQYWGCFSVNQISVISQVICEENRTSICGEMHGCVWHVQVLPLSWLRLGGALVFLPGAEVQAIVGLWPVIVVILAHAITWIVKTVEILGERRVTFGPGTSVLLVASLSPSCSRALAVLSRGSRNQGVVAAASTPQGVRGSNHCCGCLMVTRTYRLPYLMRNMDRKRFCVVSTCPWECLAWGHPFPSKSKHDCHLLLPNCPNKTCLRSSNGWSEPLQASTVSKMS